ncbi:NCS1 nucleoside transporter [Apiospora kogelbergensis]|uniref:NCS1 nucleoside transporter n=1 Tax=Apiospora kogelbergensis TaxID=1337665 RepID=UPI00312FC467
MTVFSSLAVRLRVPSQSRVVSNVWINDDIRPLPPHRRTWTRWAYISFWAINQICISNWQLGASLVALGLSVWQAVIALFLGKLMTAAVAILNGYVGAEWHIGFPVVSRYVWGVYGQYAILIQRIILSLVWFSVESWTGGLCMQNILAAIFPSYQNMQNHFPESVHMTTKQFVGFVIFDLLMVPILWLKPERLRFAVLYMNIISAVTMISIMICHRAGQLRAGVGHRVRDDGRGGLHRGGADQPARLFALRPPAGDQVLGQYSSIILLGTIMPFFGCLASSASREIYGEAIWNPPNLVQRWLDTSYSPGARAAAFFAGLGLLVCQLAICTIDDGFSGAVMDLAGLVPTYIDIRRGAYVVLVLSIAMCPWELLASAGVFINILSAYGVFLGPIVGIMTCEYWVLRKRRVKLTDLYHPGRSGVYYYWNGVNVRAFVSWILGFSYLIPGFVHNVNPAIEVPKACEDLFNLAFPLGFTVSFLVHLGINKLAPPVGLAETDDADYYNTFTFEEAARLGVAPGDALVGEKSTSGDMKNQLDTRATGLKV